MLNRGRQRLSRKLLGLGTGEVVAAAIFVLLAVQVTARIGAAAPALWSALVPLLLVLLQGGVYWLARSRAVGRPLPTGLGPVYRAFRHLDVGVLILGLIGVILWWPSDPGVAGLVLAVWVFGVVEFVNYFVVRLAYPPARWFAEVGRWRTPQLVKDLGETRGGEPGCGSVE